MPDDAPQGGGAPQGGFDNFYQQYLAPAEGGYAPNDGNGAPVNFGINQKSNPDVDVKNMTQAQAKAITYERYWKPSGADQLPPGLAEVQADTAFNMGVEAAQRLLQQSGGDVNKYLELREQRYRSIAQANPDKARYLPTWLDRNEKLRQYVSGGSQGGQGGAPAEGGIPGMRRVQTAQEKGLTPAQQQQQFRSDRTFEASIRDDMRQDPAIKNYGDVDSSYRQIRALTAKAKPTPSDDTALTFAYLKMLDPGSVVREGEFALVARAAGLPDRIVIALNKLDEGNGLTPNIRRDIISAAGAVYGERRKSYDASVAEYRRIAQESGVDPDKVVKEGGLPRSDGSPGASAQQGDFSPAQRAYADRLIKQNPNVAQLQPGSKGRPFAPRSEADFNGIKAGQWYVDDDGKVYQKGR
jgi:hypothetical protein